MQALLPLSFHSIRAPGAKGIGCPSCTADEEDRRGGPSHVGKKLEGYTTQKPLVSQGRQQWNDILSPDGPRPVPRYSTPASTCPRRPLHVHQEYPCPCHPGLQGGLRAKGCTTIVHMCSRCSINTVIEQAVRKACV